jgi:hypothetical protein
MNRQLLILCVALALAFEVNAQKSHIGPLTVGFDPDPVYVGDKVAFNYSITNSGPDLAPAQSFEVELYVDQHLVSFDRTPASLEAGQTTTYSMSDGFWDWVATNAGVHSYSLTIKPRTNRPTSQVTTATINGRFIVHAGIPTDRKEVTIATKTRKVISREAAIENATQALATTFPGQTIPKPERIADTTNENTIVFSPMSHRANAMSNAVIEVRVHKTDCRINIVTNRQPEPQPTASAAASRGQ